MDVKKNSCEIIKDSNECHWCEGTGIETIEFGTWKIACPNCNGKGFVYENEDKNEEE